MYKLIIDYVCQGMLCVGLLALTAKVEKNGATLALMTTVGGNKVL